MVKKNLPRDQHREGFYIRRDATSNLNMELFFDVLRYNFSIEQVDDAVRIVSIIWRVGNHDDRCSFLVELGQQLHHFFAIRGIKITGRLIGEDHLGFCYYRT